MIEQELTIVNKLGLHARASAKLVNTAGRFGSKVEIDFAGQTADAKSIMQVMMLAASIGSQIKVRATGADEDEAVKALSELIKNYFEEEE
jgi:phosphocarrier protein